MNDGGAIVATATNANDGDQHAVMLLPVQITKVISNQITGVECNELPTGLPYKGDYNNPMLMAANTGKTVNLSIVVNAPQAFISKILVGVRQTGTTTILASTPAQLGPTETHLQFQAIDGANMYQVVAGYDSNGNGVLDPSEVSVVYAGSGGTSPTSPQDKVIAITADGNKGTGIFSVSNSCQPPLIWGILPLKHK